MDTPILWNQEQNLKPNVNEIKAKHLTSGVSSETNAQNR